MRADRLIAITMMLQAHEQLTAAEIAGRLDVSVRTIRRDLDLLARTGVPLYSERGHGGGWRLVPGWRSDLSGLTADEAHALFLVAGPAALPGLGQQPAVLSALRKLLAALPSATRPDATDAAATLLVDPARWGAPALAVPALLGELTRIVRDGCRARVRYAGRDARAAGEPARDRIVDPYGLVNKGGVWYLIAGSDGAPRTLRVSRIEAVTALDEPARRPDDLDLGALWEQSRRQVERRMWACQVRLRADPEIVPILLWVLGSRRRLRPVDGPPSDDPPSDDPPSDDRPSDDRPSDDRLGDDAPPAADGATARWPAFVAAFPSPAVAAADLAGFGARVVVDEPADRPDGVTAHLQRIGAELLGRYPSSADHAPVTA